MKLYKYTLEVRDGDQRYYRTEFIMADSQQEAVDWAAGVAKIRWGEGNCVPSGNINHPHRMTEHDLARYFGEEHAALAAWEGPGGRSIRILYVRPITHMSVTVYPGGASVEVDLSPRIPKERGGCPNAGRVAK